MRILITNWRLNALAGSEINVLEFAELWRSQGHGVTVWGQDAKGGTPWHIEAQKLGFESSNPSGHYDVAWLHHAHQAMPKFSATKIINYTMSPWIPEERPLASADVVLANSIETANKWRDEVPAIRVFPNSAPDAFFSANSTAKDHIAIVSNHVPVELVAASNILRSHGIYVTHYGEGGIIKRITPEILSQHSAVVTIGKTVQYAMAMNIPVFCYDNFGGPGWITKENIVKSSEFNFSGRCCKRFISAEIIAKEIMSIPKNCSHRDYALEHFSLTKNMEGILK